MEEIPFLPVEFFKSHQVIAEGMKAEVVFESSGTTADNTSRHHVAEVSLYRESFLRSFLAFYGSPEDLCILALLPSYLERSGSLPGLHDGPADQLVGDIPTADFTWTT